MGFAALWAFLLLPLPWLMARLRQPSRTGLHLGLPESYLAAARTQEGQGRPPSPWGGWLVWGLFCLALAQPQILRFHPDQSASGRDILLALDMSGSMEIEDFTLNGEVLSRLTAVQQVASTFIRSRQGDRIGLVIFADRAYVASPLSHDLEAVVRALEETQIGLTGRSTAISEGLGLALKRSLQSDASSKVILLFSDGRETAARLEARDVAKLSASHGVRVHSVALGPDDLESTPSARDAVDTALLRDIAELTGGETFRVRSFEDLRAMAQTLDALEPNPASRPPLAVWQPLWIWPAALALLGLLGLRVRAWKV